MKLSNNYSILKNPVDLLLLPDYEQEPRFKHLLKFKISRSYASAWTFFKITIAEEFKSIFFKLLLFFFLLFSLATAFFNYKDYRLIGKRNSLKDLAQLDRLIKIKSSNSFLSYGKITDQLVRLSLVSLAHSVFSRWLSPFFSTIVDSVWFFIFFVGGDRGITGQLKGTLGLITERFFNFFSVQSKHPDNLDAKSKKIIYNILKGSLEEGKHFSSFLEDLKDHYRLLTAEPNNIKPLINPLKKIILKNDQLSSFLKKKDLISNLDTDLEISDKPSLNKYVYSLTTKSLGELDFRSGVPFNLLELFDNPFKFELTPFSKIQKNVEKSENLDNAQVNQLKQDFITKTLGGIFSEDKLYKSFFKGAISIDKLKSKVNLNNESSNWFHHLESSNSSSIEENIGIANNFFSELNIEIIKKYNVTVSQLPPLFLPIVSEKGEFSLSNKKKIDYQSLKRGSIREQFTKQYFYFIHLVYTLKLEDQYKSEIDNLPRYNFIRLTKNYLIEHIKSYLPIELVSTKLEKIDLENPLWLGNSLMNFNQFIKDNSKNHLDLILSKIESRAAFLIFIAIFTVSQLRVAAGQKYYLQQVLENGSIVGKNLNKSHTFFIIHVYCSLFLFLILFLLLNPLKIGINNQLRKIVFSHLELVNDKTFQLKSDPEFKKIKDFINIFDKEKEYSVKSLEINSENIEAKSILKPNKEMDSRAESIRQFLEKNPEVIESFTPFIQEFIRYQINFAEFSNQKEEPPLNSISDYFKENLRDQTDNSDIFWSCLTQLLKEEDIDWSEGNVINQIEDKIVPLMMNSEIFNRKLKEISAEPFLTQDENKVDLKSKQKEVELQNSFNKIYCFIDLLEEFLKIPLELREKKFIKAEKPSDYYSIIGFVIKAYLPLIKKIEEKYTQQRSCLSGREIYLKAYLNPLEQIVDEIGSLSYLISYLNIVSIYYALKVALNEICYPLLNADFEKSLNNYTLKISNAIFFISALLIRYLALPFSASKANFEHSIMFNNADETIKRENKKIVTFEELKKNPEKSIINEFVDPIIGSINSSITYYLKDSLDISDQIVNKVVSHVLFSDNSLEKRFINLCRNQLKKENKKMTLSFLTKKYSNSKIGQQNSILPNKIGDLFNSKWSISTLLKDYFEILGLEESLEDLLNPFNKKIESKNAFHSMLGLSTKDLFRKFSNKEEDKILNTGIRKNYVYLFLIKPLFILAFLSSLPALALFCKNEMNLSFDRKSFFKDVDSLKGNTYYILISLYLRPLKIDLGIQLIKFIYGCFRHFSLLLINKHKCRIEKVNL